MSPEHNRLLLELSSTVQKTSFEFVLSGLVDIAHLQQRAASPRTVRALSRLARKLQSAEALASSANL